MVITGIAHEPPARSTCAKVRRMTGDGAEAAAAGTFCPVILLTEIVVYLEIPRCVR